MQNSINEYTFKKLSKITSIPILNYLSPKMNIPANENHLSGFLKAQKLALKAAESVAAMVKVGWSEKQAAGMLGSYLKDSGVQAFFHQPYCWFGERSAFHGMNKYKDAMPSGRTISEGEVFILDVAPIVNGYVCDIGYTTSLGKNEELEKAKRFLLKLEGEIPVLFMSGLTGGEIWKSIDSKMSAAGYGNAYQDYPFSVLGHRVHRASEKHLPMHLYGFEWQAFWNLASRGLFGQLLNQNFEGSLIGLWAIEPHLSTPKFGAKFEKILVVTSDSAYWLGDEK